MEHFFDWFRRQGELDRPWLILGKGPTFGRRDRYDLRAYRLLSLNHAVREQPVLLAHMIDLDVVDACGETLLRQAGHVVLPWYPHVRNAPGSRSLEELVPGHALLRRLAEEGRLLWYDLSTAARRHGPGPVVQATYFSAEAAVGLLALAGVRRVRSLGVDGGAGYSTDFEDLARRTLLANGHPGFDLQFQGIARTIMRTGVDFAPLDQPSPIVVGILSSETSVLPEKVLEFSLRRHTSMSVRVHPIRSPADVEAIARIANDEPAVAGPDGLRRAIVLPSGSLVLDDLRKLWTRPREREAVEVPRGQAGEPPLAPAVAQVSAADAERLGAMVQAILTSAGARSELAGLASDIRLEASLPPSWGRPDRFKEGDTSLLRYSAAGRQPWISRAHPFGHLWVTTLLDAVREGFVTVDLIRAEVGLGHVRPSLLEQVLRGRPESLLLSRSARRRDAGFTPPGGAPATSAGAFTNLFLVLPALARDARRRLAAFRRRASAGVAPEP